MEPKTVYIAADHAGFAAKEKLKEKLIQLGHEPQDMGPDSDARVDYPDYADQVCRAMNDRPQSMGLLICGSGQGMAMRANKFPHIRAALCWNEESAKQTREHNNANVLCLGSRFTSEAEQFKILETFLQEEFAGGRHQARVEKISGELV